MVFVFVKLWVDEAVKINFEAVFRTGVEAERGRCRFRNDEKYWGEFASKADS